MHGHPLEIHGTPPNIYCEKVLLIQSGVQGRADTPPRWYIFKETPTFTSARRKENGRLIIGERVQIHVQLQVSDYLFSVRTGISLKFSLSLRCPIIKSRKTCYNVLSSSFHGSFHRPLSVCDSATSDHKSPASLVEVRIRARKQYILFLRGLPELMHPTTLYLTRSLWKNPCFIFLGRFISRYSSLSVFS